MSDIFYEVMRDYSTDIHYSYGKNPCSLHFHHQLELLYVDCGKVTVVLNDEKRTLEEGHLAIIDSFDNHQYLPEFNTKTHCLIIPVHFLKKYAATMHNKSLKYHFITNKNEANRIFKCMKDVIEHQKDNDLILDGYISILLGNIIIDNVVFDKNKTNYDLLKSILIYIEDNFKTTITLDSIAKHFGYSKYYFSHLFNKCFHCNLNDYLNLVRCRHTINYVLEEHMTVSEAAFSSGFISMRTFYRTFKKNFNLTPNEYFLSKAKTIDK